MQSFSFSTIFWTENEQIKRESKESIDLYIKSAIKLATETWQNDVWLALGEIQGKQSQAFCYADDDLIYFNCVTIWKVSPKYKTRTTYINRSPGWLKPWEVYHPWWLQTPLTLYRRLSCLFGWLRVSHNCSMGIEHSAEGQTRKSLHQLCSMEVQALKLWTVRWSASVHCMILKVFKFAQEGFKYREREYN